MDTKKKIVTFGEIMLRLTPPSRLRFNQTKLFQASYGGSEANVAVALANYGLRCEFVTCLPDNRIAEACLDDLRSYGVETGHVLRCGNRIGLYYMEEAAAMRSSHVVYDRAGSSYDLLRPGMIDWAPIFRDAAWFTGRGSRPPSVLRPPRRAPKPSPRPALPDWWCRATSTTAKTSGNTQNPAGSPAAAHGAVRLLLRHGRRIRTILGLQLPKFEARDASYRPDTAGYETASRQVAERFPHCRGIVFGLRSVLSANHHLISGTLYTGGRLYSSRVYDIDCVVDCVGVGDAFVGGLIYGLARHAGRCSLRWISARRPAPEKHRAGRLRAVHGRRHRTTGPRSHYRPYRPLTPVKKPGAPLRKGFYGRWYL